MNDEFLSLTELGRLYGVSSHIMGRWLVALGLRTGDKKPSTAAFQGGYVTQRASTRPGTYFWVWHAQRTMRMLGEAGYRKRGDAGPAADEHAPGDDRHGDTRPERGAGPC
jgi:hypothetical protein